MFDIGFSELALVLIVALVVVGPERLPRLVRTAGLYLGRARRAVSAIKADVQRELAAEELKRTLHEQAQSTGLHEIIEETREAATTAERMLNTEDAAAPGAGAQDTPPSAMPGTQQDSQNGSRHGSD